MAGFQVEAILIEELVDIKQEYYCSIALDASGRQFFIIASNEGGIDIEEVSKTNPEVIIKESFSYMEGLTEELALEVATKLGFTPELVESAICATCPPVLLCEVVPARRDYEARVGRWAAEAQRAQRG